MQAQQYKWKTAAVIRETKDAVTIVFETGEIPFEYKAGQFLNVSLVIDEERFTRSYSLSSCPAGDEKPAITVKRMDGGIVSNYIFDNAEVINEWNVSGAFGTFYPDEKISQGKQFVLVAGGSGITPSYSILKYLIKNTEASILLIYCNRTEEDVIYSKALNYLESIYSNRLQVYHVLSRAKQGEELSFKNYITGRLSKLVLKKILKKVFGSLQVDVDFFLCGPSGLIELAEGAVKDIYPEEVNIYREYFKSEVSKEITVKLPISPQEVLLHYYDQTNLLHVAAGQSILGSALEDKIPMRYSCKSGICGVCKAKLIEGNVHMERNFALTDSELNDGYILLCQSYPLNSEVTVVVD